MLLKIIKIYLNFKNMSKIPKKVIQEFINKHCTMCKAYPVCGAELAGCPDWENFIKTKK